MPKSFLDKMLNRQNRRTKRAIRKAITGSGDSLKVQARKKIRKALTGSSAPIGTQIYKRTGCGCFTLPLLLATMTIAICTYYDFLMCKEGRNEKT